MHAVSHILCVDTAVYLLFINVLTYMFCMEYVLDSRWLVPWTLFAWLATSMSDPSLGSGETSEAICVGSWGKCCDTKCDLNGGHQTKFGYSTDGGSFGKGGAFKLNEVVLKNCEVVKGDVQDQGDGGHCWCIIHLKGLKGLEVEVNNLRISDLL